MKTMFVLSVFTIAACSSLLCLPQAAAQETTAVSDEQMLYGEVVAVNATGSTVTVKELSSDEKEGADVVFQVKKNTIIQKDDAVVSLEKLANGNLVTVTYLTDTTGAKDAIMITVDAN